jgi:prepilin-type N-terminal cleavage/methylation domain-containing protein
MHTRKQTSFYGKSSGFTLIELLVVISIISLLIAILLPALAAARATSQRIKCAAIQRQIGLAIHMYADDFDDYVPYVGTTSNMSNWYSQPTSNPWSRVLMESDYIHEPAGRTATTFPRKEHPFYCPSDNSDYGGGSNAGKRSFGLANAYCWNGTVFAPKRRDDMISPSKVVLTADQTGVYRFVLGGSAITYYHVGTVQIGNEHSLTFTHVGDTTNALFGDSHIETAGYDTAVKYIVKNSDLPS